MSARTVRLSLVAVLVGLAGCATGPFYDTRTIRHTAFTPDQIAGARRDLAARLGAAKVALEDARGTARETTIAALPPAAVQAIWIALDSGDDKVPEADRWMATSVLDRVPVTVRRDDERWTVRVGPTNAPWPRGNARDLSPRWGIGPLVDRGRAWTDDAAARVDLALARLSPEERSAVGAVPFARAPQAEKPMVGEYVIAAEYRQEGCAARIEVYDSAIATDATNFVGEPEAPLEESVRSILHEVGHAIHHLPGRVAICAIESDRKSVDAHSAGFNRRVDAYNALSPFARTQAESEKIDRARGVLEEEIEGFQRRQKAAVSLAESKGPVLEAYARALDGESAPTRYGTESLAESFAESFSLFRADPAALRRLLPRVHAFFERGDHVRAMATR